MRGLNFSTAQWAIVAGAALATPVAAQAQTYPLDIPAGALGDSLRALGQATQQQIIFSESTVRGRTAPTVRGSYTVDQALSQLLAGTSLGSGRTAGGVLYVGAGAADGAEPASAAVAESDIVVTGTRIKNGDAASAAPMNVIPASALTDRGFVQAGDMLNQVTSNVPSFATGPFQGVPAGSGQTYPNLFGLGPGRTLTLVNSRRMVTSGSGTGARTVDVNMIPTGLIDRIDVVEGGGAAVYGSDAIAGVVNYVLKRNFAGVELDVQNTFDTAGARSNPSARITAGTNFGDGRGNVAIDLEYSKTYPIVESERPYFRDAPRSVTNPLNVSTSDGQPPSIIIYNGRLWRYNRNGVVFGANSTLASALVQVNGSPVQFSPDGTGLIPYNTGVIQAGNSSTALGGDGHDPRLLSTFLAGVERYNASLIGHYDLSDNIRLSTELLYSRQKGTDSFATQDIARFVGGGSSFAAIPFNRNNPYLTATQVTQLTAASPTFASGGNIFLSKWFNILPDRAGYATTDTGRGLIALDGDFTVGSHRMNWSLSASHGETDQDQQNYAQWVSHFNNAVNAVRNPAGQIVCAINADATTANDDPACIPFNPFGDQRPSQAVLDYVTTILGSNIHNKQDDFLATLSGGLITLPGGEVQYALAYEHRAESATFTPNANVIAGYGGFTSAPTSGKYNTDELSAELALPLVGGDFTLPLVERLELTGSFRHVDNSLAGTENVWGLGARWTVGLGLTLRASRSRNFAAPTLDQQFAPINVSPGNPAQNPCDNRIIASGNFPANRLANCQALFAANPGYGPLASFQDPSFNTGLVSITSQGNPNLKNEISNTFTAGAQWEPPFIPGLSLSADYIKIRLKDAIQSFGLNDFLAACFDSVPQPVDICSTFTRNAQGYLVSGVSQTYNVGLLRYEGETYKMNYRFGLGGNAGTISLHAEAVHNRRFETAVVGGVPGRSDGTQSVPRWRQRFDINYANGPFRLFYSVYHLPASKASYTATIENTTFPVIAANTVHTISAQYDIGAITLRAGVNNLFDRAVSIPTRSYGDFYGRRAFVGARVRF